MKPSLDVIVSTKL